MRIIAIIIIFIGHSAIQFNCNYSFLSPLINLRVPAMTLFFMLSGFVLYVTYGRTNLFSQEKLKEYYVKRAIGIIPTYYLIAIVYIVFLWKRKSCRGVRIAAFRANSYASNPSRIRIY